MAHVHYRSEKNCLNCGYQVELHFCSQCGQENRENNEPFWVLFGEGFSDFFHFDSRFFRSIVPLFIKPGFLTREYLNGRRVSYINPVRLYFFVSIVMLLISGYLFKRFDYQKMINNIQVKASQQTKPNLEKQIRVWSTSKLPLAVRRKAIDSLKDKEAALDTLRQDVYHLRDSIPITNNFASTKKKISAEQIIGEKGAIYMTLEEFATHDLKIFLILLLPLFALFLKILYVRRKVHYQDHIITMLHMQSFLILFLSLILFVPIFFPQSWPAVSWVSFIVIVTYVIFTLRRVYRQNYVKTLIKSFLFLCLITLTLIFTAAIYIGVELILSIKSLS